MKSYTNIPAAMHVPNATKHFATKPLAVDMKQPFIRLVIAFSYEKTVILALTFPIIFIAQLFKCLLCNDSHLIQTETEFVQHLQCAHDGHGRYAMCSICNAYFDQPTYLRLHMETSCGRLRTWTCAECGIECVSADALDEHTKSIHSNDDCIKVEENPLILPKIEVSAIEYQCIDEEERQFATEYFKSECDNSNDHCDDEVFDNADAEAGMEWESEDDDDDEAIDIKDEFDSFDDIDQDEVNESDEAESEATILNEKHKCQYCPMVYTTLNRLLVHMKNHGTIHDIHINPIRLSGSGNS